MNSSAKVVRFSMLFQVIVFILVITRVAYLALMYCGYSPYFSLCRKLSIMYSWQAHRRATVKHRAFHSRQFDIEIRFLETHALAVVSVFFTIFGIISADGLRPNFIPLPEKCQKNTATGIPTTQHYFTATLLFHFFHFIAYLLIWYCL